MVSSSVSVSVDEIGVLSDSVCQFLFFLPFFVSVPFKLRRGHSGGLTLQCPHAAHLSL